MGSRLGRIYTVVKNVPDVKGGEKQRRKRKKKDT